MGTHPWSRAGKYLMLRAVGGGINKSRILFMELIARLSFEGSVGVRECQL